MKFPISELKNEDFPPLIKEINDPPKKLFIRGQLPEEGMAYLAVVGARKNSTYGKEVCEKLISGLRGQPIVIVSGLALGIDGIAHRAALSAGLKTIAVPGSGLDPKVLYPSSRLSLAEKILESGGALISEFEPNFRATVWSFPQRNRIMAGMSKAVLIIEAEKRSGTLITSKLASDYNRDVLAVPGSIFSQTSEGPNMLIELGATPITKSEDIIQALGLKITEKETTPIREKYTDCTHEEMKIIELLSEPRDRNDVIRESGMPTHLANSVISFLEIKGLISQSDSEIHLI